jgi:hypothetical protein
MLSFVPGESEAFEAAFEVEDFEAEDLEEEDVEEDREACFGAGFETGFEDNRAVDGGVELGVDVGVVRVCGCTTAITSKHKSYELL